MDRMWATAGRQSTGGEGLGLLLPLSCFPGGFPFSDLNPAFTGKASKSTVLLPSRLAMAAPIRIQ